MALASSIGKQIAPWVYEDLNKKKTIPQNTGLNVNQSQEMFWAWMQQPSKPTAPTGQAPDWLWTPKKVATTQTPVITRSAPAPTTMTPPATDLDTRSDTQLKDYITWAWLNSDKLSQEEQFKLARASQMLTDRTYQQTMVDPTLNQIEERKKEKAQQEAKLQEQNQQLMDARRKELELMYGKKIAGEQEAGQRTMNAAQRVLSFSGWWRSSYAAEKQAEIQQQVNENINILNAERDVAMQKYEAELQWATAEQLAWYDEMIFSLQQRSAEFSVQLAKQMNEYNMQTAASYQEKVDNILQLAQSMQTVELTPWQMEEANAYATLLLDAEWNINEKMLADIPPTMKWYALRKAAELKVNMPKKFEAPETIAGADWAIYAWNEQTGELEKVIGWKPMQSDKTIKFQNADWSETIMQYNVETGQYDIPVTPSWFTPNGTPVNSAIQKAIEKNQTGAQCGKFVNDILQNMWLPRLIWDSYQSKEMAISQIGIATNYNDMWAGSIFAYPVKWSQYWHIGIVTALNDDWTIDIMDYNYKWDQQRRERRWVDPAEIINMWWRISKPIIRGDTVQVEPKPLTKEEKKDLFSIQDDLKSDPRRKEYLTLQSKIKTLDWIKNRLDTGKATAQDKQQLISDFAKILDPTSVVRTEEYTLAAKYWQSAINKTIQEISNWYSTNWPLSDTSAKVLAEAIGLRFEAVQSSNNEAVQEQLKRAEIFLWRPVKPEELWVTPQKQTTTNTSTGVTQSKEFDDLRNSL